MMKIKLRHGDSLTIGNAVVRLVEKSGQFSCLTVEAPRDIAVHLDRGVKSQPAQSKNFASPPN